ncbi:MAG: saccharopine dehydrogenase NADP-binding domain-containing protein [Pseudomonadota bacterium]
MTTREFDIIVWGATGFTGRLVTEYLAGEYGVGGELKWAVAGRSPEKLAAVMAEVGATEAPRVIADAGDPASLDEMARRAKVVLTTVGPYQKYGEPLVAACAAAGTDYVDLCGEPPFMRRMIDAYSDKALETGARIVHSCGFDSIPFDLGVYYVQKLYADAYGAPARDVKCRVLDMRGGMSGGTAASAVATLELAEADAQVRDVMRDVYALAPDPSATRPRQPNVRTPHYDADAGVWAAPFIMADINMRNVHRSNMLMEYAYGRDFRYSEMMAAPNAAAAYAIAGGMGAFGAGLAFAPTRALLKSAILPKPGEGPSKRQREAGYFKALFIAKGEGGAMAKAMVTGDRDPGYGSTSKMISEAAACLALDLPKGSNAGGVTTPAAAMGDALIERLTARAGLTFGSA